MRQRNQRTVLGWVALALLLGLGGMALDGYLPHTDDGCPVEVHCSLCRWHLGTAGVVAPAVALPLALDPAGPAVLQAATPLRDAATPAASTRGPPLA